MRKINLSSAAAPTDYIAYYNFNEGNSSTLENTKGQINSISDNWGFGIYTIDNKVVNLVYGWASE